MGTFDSVKRPSDAGFDRLMGMFDSAHKSHNPMDAGTYIGEYTPAPTQEHKYEKDEKEHTSTPTPTPTPAPTDKDLMFDALILIKKRFHLSSNKKIDILAEIRRRPKKSAEFKSLAALTEHFTKNPDTGSKTRRHVQKEWMRDFLKTEHRQPETRGRKSKR
jgi:hypothetical protein